LNYDDLNHEHQRRRASTTTNRKVLAIQEHIFVEVLLGSDEIERCRLAPVVMGSGFLVIEERYLSS
jgi:hypothetical protein